MKIRMPDYQELVNLLPKLRQLVDATGIVRLEREEAEKIRILGFQAEAGPWHVPPLPADLVAGNPLLEHLAETTDSFWLPPERTGVVPAPEIVQQADLANSTGTRDELNPDSTTIMAAINRAGGTIERRKIQNKLWRIPATRFNHALEHLIATGMIELDGKMIKAPHNQECSTTPLPPAKDVQPDETAVPVRESGGAEGPI